MYQKGIPNEIKAHKLAMKAVKKTAHKESEQIIIFISKIKSIYKTIY